MKYIVAINQDDLPSFSPFIGRENVFPANTGYKIQQDGHLYYSKSDCYPARSVMFITIDPNVKFRRFDKLLSEILYAYRKSGSSGIVLNGCIGQNADGLISAIRRNLRTKIFIPSEMSGGAGALKIVSTSISGGTLGGLLRRYVSMYGNENTAVSAELVRSDFELPAFSGTGHELTLSQTQELITSHRTPSFYSDELETNYFNYSSGGKAHIVLFDNGKSLRRKVALAESLGINYCFLSYSETKDILSKIIV